MIADSAIALPVSKVSIDTNPIKHTQATGEQWNRGADLEFGFSK
jgi:hypothetical protein